MKIFLPRDVDITCEGHRLALWMFGLVVLLKASIGLGTIFNGRHAAVSADGMTLDSFPADGAQTFLSLRVVHASR